MDFRIFTEPQQGADYADLLRMAQATEQLGFDGFFRSDHYLAMGVDGAPGPTDAWLTLAALAVQTERIRLGTLVTSATFRLPGPLAISVAQVDRMSGGRVDFGLGAGWYAAEHTAYGIGFPDTKQRFEVLSEQLAIITGLWATPEDETFSYSGDIYQVVDSPALPKPIQHPIPVIIGGGGKRRTPALAAQYAAEFNSAFAPADEAGVRFERVRAACAAIDRDPASIVMSAAETVCVGRDDAEFLRRADAIGRDPRQLRSEALGGTVSEVTDKIGALADAGATRLYLQVLDLTDLDHLELVAEVSNAVGT
ncbi:LLM class F420-dependent oxidoreductase [Nakamurella aerolata]|uniref:LLM class F420-dependent oxidoreductase n=1 Tax=Nakamurella aerolata TaxID=1656892 RepID=A0A849A8I1_9ACTN|nr:LLM class F420-dependent oxidoreductase [Nakamurella aerolata]NNG34780.1 LLM class F420-dependent oxidoreductase [Nakamurella aerolata]